MGMTVRGLESLKPGKWLSDEGHKNEGALRAKGGPKGARFYFRYRNSAGGYDDLPVGLFNRDGENGLTLTAAKARAKVLRNRYLSGDRDLRVALEADQRERERQREASAQAAKADAAMKRATLGALLTAYVEQLTRDAKADARKVEGTLHRHVRDAWPVLWATPAAQITTDDLLTVLARLTDDGKLREAGKLRSYLSAAYAAAIRARQDARGLAALRVLKITHNPARDLVTVDGSSQPRERALSVAELRAYWKRICALPDEGGALLRFHLLTGCQRTEQLGRLTIDDFDTDLQTVRIRDGKGRRKVARLHDVPVLPSALEAMQAMGQELGPYLVTVTRGHSGAVYASFQHRVRAVVGAMDEARELEKGPFTVGDLRRTVETRLAAVGVSKEVRAQLQSHGLGGVQARHYDQHEYLSEKRAALETLHRLLTGKGATVTPFKRKAS